MANPWDDTNLDLAARQAGLAAAVTDLGHTEAVLGGLGRRHRRLQNRIAKAALAETEAIRARDIAAAAVRGWAAAVADLDETVILPPE